MGQILSAPITTKHSTEGKDARLMYGASSMQGWRISMYFIQKVFQISVY
jgi:protein phosphatase 2C family protein 2/3